MTKILRIFALAVLAVVVIFVVAGFVGSTKKGAENAGTNLTADDSGNGNTDETLVNGDVAGETLNENETVDTNSNTDNVNENLNLDTLAEEAISVTDSGFSPKSLTVAKGTIVTWTNNASVTVYVAPDDHPAHTKYAGIWDDDGTGQILTGESYSHIFDTVGTFTYHNHLESSQTGTITVTE